MKCWPFLPFTFATATYNYRIHSEEILIHTLCKVATGMMQEQIVDT
jgi:hypothetical protein